MRRQDRHMYRPERSPRREYLNSELDEHSHRIKELLRADLNILEEENAILKSKCKKVGELESKVELILRQNSQLLSENQKISKLLHETRSDYEIMKNKYETNMAQRLNFSAELQFEKKKLINEIDHLQNEIQELQHSRTYQVNEMKSQSQLEIQALKRQLVSSQDAYEQELRKNREQIQRRDYEIAELNNKLKRFSSETEYEMVRQSEEKQKLRSELVFQQNEHRADVENLRIKLESNYMSEMEAMKRNYTMAINNLDTENEKLKDYLRSRDFEIQEVSTKLGKQKAHFEETIGLLRKENQALKGKIFEDQKFNESELDNLKGKLRDMHEGEIQQLKINHQRYIDCLQGEINKLQGFLKIKNEEIEQLIKEKSSVRQIFANEGSRFKEETDALNFRIRDLEAQIKMNEEKNQQRLREKDEDVKYLNELNAEQHENNEKEVQALQKIIKHQTNQIEQEKRSSEEREQSLKEKVSQTSIQLHNAKDQAKRLRASKERDAENLRNEYEKRIIELQTRVENLTTKTGTLGKENQSLKGALELKEKENLNLHLRMKNADQREKRLEKDNEDLRLKMIKKDQKSNQLLAQQKKRLENSFSYTVDNLKADHESALQLERNKLTDANEKINKKEKEIEDLLKAYKKMREEIEVLTSQEANKKDLTLKFPGATADLLATKNVFDVFLKTKVLDVCGDAKENIS